MTSNSVQDQKEGVTGLEEDLNNVSLQENGHGVVDTEAMESFDDVTTGLPNIVIVTNLADTVFEETHTRASFESLLKAFDATAKISYLKSFRRARVEYSTASLAAKAKIHLHETDFADKRIKCYFAQTTDDSDDTKSPHLELPKLEKQFLISPPCSPPVGWEPVHEAEPIINYDLINAIAGLAPGESHELHPPSVTQPGIIVHICEDPIHFDQRPKLVQTKCPERKS